MIGEMGSFERVLFVVNPIEPPQKEIRTILVNGNLETVEAWTGVNHGNESERMNLAWEGVLASNKLVSDRRISAANGAKGPPAKAAKAKQKKAAKATTEAKRNAPRMEALETFRRAHPDCTLTEAADALLEANTIPNQEAGEKWLGRMVKGRGIEPFEPGQRGRKHKSRGVVVRKPR